MANDNNNILKENSTAGESPGQLLANQRKKINLSEREAADALKISVSRLKSIENDDFSVFPSETYIKGHLKNYSRLLKCHEQDILSAYDLMRPAGASVEFSDVQESSHVDNHHKRWWLVYGVLVLLALVWVLSYWLLGTKDEPPVTAIFPESGITESPGSSVGGDDEDNQRSIEPVLPRTLASQDEVAPVDSSVVIDGFSPTDSLPGETNQATIADDSSDEKTLVVSKLTAAELVESIKAKEEQKEAVVEKEVEGDTLEFGFENSSWIQVIDATGKVLFKGLNKPGAELALNGTAPFNIVIGNVEGTSLVYNGEDVTLNAPAGKNTLRLTLGG